MTIGDQTSELVNLLAEGWGVATPAADPATSYTFGYNNGGTREHEVLKVTLAEEGKLRSVKVILSGISEPKAKAIALILNAPEL